MSFSKILMNSHGISALARSSRMNTMILLVSLGALFQECSAAGKTSAERIATAEEKFRALQRAQQKRNKELLEGSDSSIPIGNSAKVVATSDKCDICHTTKPTDAFYKKCGCAGSICKDCVLTTCNANECPFCKQCSDTFFSGLTPSEISSKKKVIITCQTCKDRIEINTERWMASAGTGQTCKNCNNIGLFLPGWYRDAYEHYSVWLEKNLREMEKERPKSKFFKTFQKRYFKYKDDRIEYFEDDEMMKPKGYFLRSTIKSVKPVDGEADRLIVEAINPKYDKVRPYTFKVLARDRDAAVNTLRKYMNDAPAK